MGQDGLEEAGNKRRVGLRGHLSASVAKVRVVAWHGSLAGKRQGCVGGRAELRHYSA